MTVEQFSRGSSLSNIRIFCHQWLEAGTILVSPDIYEYIKRQYGVEELDRKFLTALGIDSNSSPKSDPISHE
jgi:hypothetical protein